MPEVGYELDPGPLNFKAPWLMYSGPLLPPEPQPAGTVQSHQQRASVSRPPKGDREIKPPRKRQRRDEVESGGPPDAIDLVSSEGEHDPDSPPLRRIPIAWRGERTSSQRVSAKEGMAAAKRLALEAIRQTSTKKEEEIKTPFSEETVKLPPGIKRLGGHTNSFEIKNKTILRGMGILKDNLKRGGLSDPDALAKHTGDSIERILQEYTSSDGLGLDSLSVPPSSYIPFDLD
ncbi:hypothetical protein AAE478_004385 [Parahypoxylon ruwenzoriense]